MRVFNKLITLCSLVAALTSSSPAESNPTQDTSEQTSYDYYQKVVKKNPGLSQLLKEKKLPEYLSAQLAKLEHSTPKGYPESQDSGQGNLENQEKPSTGYLKNFKDFFLTETYFILQALQNSEFRSKIGKELELDTVDRFGEHGGVLHLSPDGKVNIEMLPNTATEQEYDQHYDPDSSYNHDAPSQTLDILTFFHFHAQEVNHFKSAALSGADYWHGGVVFTRLGRNKFNVDTAFYYKKNGKNMKVNIDLGVYTY